jgi:hypothetical protein
LNVRRSEIRVALFVVGALIALALAIVLGLSWWRKETGPPRGRRATYEVAERYLAAVIAGDKDAARRLIRGDPRCSPPFEYISAALDKHIALLKGAEVREVQITVEPQQGVDVLPGSESAEISFQHRAKDGPGEWRTSTLWLVTSPADADGARFICHLGGE